MSTFNPLFTSKHSLAVCVGGGQIKVSGLRRQNVPQMSWSNICSTVSISSQRHASRAQRDAQGWTWETKAWESIWGSRLGCTRTKGQLGNSFGRRKRSRRQPAYNSARERKKMWGERGELLHRKAQRRTLWGRNEGWIIQGALRRGLEGPFTERKWPFSPTKCFLLGSAKRSRLPFRMTIKASEIRSRIARSCALAPRTRARTLPLACALKVYIKHLQSVSHFESKLTSGTQQDGASKPVNQNKSALKMKT